MTIRVWNDRGVEDVPVSEIAEHPDNVNLGNVESIKESIRVNGFYAPLLVQASTGYILVGNHRFRAARELGLVTIPAIFMDVEDEQAMRIMLADNRTARLGHDDLTALEAALTQLAESEKGLLGSGYTHLDLSKLLADADQPLRIPPPPKMPPAERLLDWAVTTMEGEAGECTGLLLRHPDFRSVTTSDAREIYKVLGLPEPTLADLADMGVEAWR
jgi:hypothetical protein